MSNPSFLKLLTLVCPQEAFKALMIEQCKTESFSQGTLGSVEILLGSQEILEILKDGLFGGGGDKSALTSLLAQPVMGKAPFLSTSTHPISLLCHFRMSLSRLTSSNKPKPKPKPKPKILPHTNNKATPRCGFMRICRWSLHIINVSLYLPGEELGHSMLMNQGRSSPGKHMSCRQFCSLLFNTIGAFFNSNWHSLNQISVL